MGQLGDISPQGSVAIGIVVGLLSTSIQSLGLTLQRKSHLLEDEKPITEARRPPYKRRRWQLGMAMFVISNLVGSTIQITCLPLPVLSTLQASGLVFNTAFATLLLKEPFTRFSLIGTILTCIGAGLIAAFGAIGEPAHSLEQLLGLLQRKPFIIWMTVTMLVALIAVVFTHVLKIYSSHKHISKHWLQQERPRSASKSDNQARRQSFTALLPRPLQLRVGRIRLIRGLSYALISGILSAHSLLVAKSAVELLVRTIVDHNNQFNRFQSWLILLALLFFALTQLYYLHLGLRLCSTSVLYPFVFCVYNIIAILDGLIYFHQTSRLSALHAGLIALGTVVLLSGVLALSWRLDDVAPAEPPPQSLPQTPLTPGMGLMRSTEEAERSPLIPGALAHSNTAPVSSTNDERTPLLGRRKRGSTVTRYTQSPMAVTRDIWAELDDEENDQDFLASLPRSPTLPFGGERIEVPKRRRVASLSTNIPSSRSNRSSRSSRSSSPSSLQKVQFPRRSQTLQAYRRASVDTALPVSSTDGQESLRPHSATASTERFRKSPSRVRFQESSQRSSRWDAGAPAHSPDQNKDKPPDQSDEDR